LQLGDRNFCLILGDASHVVTESLVNRFGFKHATVVDNDPLVLDDYKIEKEDKRFEKVKSDFSFYNFPINKFEFVYGKSIAFVSKENIKRFLHDLNLSLKENGLFVSVFAMEGDSFRKVFYTKDELERLFSETGFTILDMQEAEGETKGLLMPGQIHTVCISAIKKETLKSY
jgi:hypothetical protein